jgi:Protein of unknown function (DUF2934)
MGVRSSDFLASLTELRQTIAGRPTASCVFDVQDAIIADPSSKSLPNRSAQVTDSDVARRAYDFYLTRGCEHRHDVDDWLRSVGCSLGSPTLQP